MTNMIDITLVNRFLAPCKNFLKAPITPDVAELDDPCSKLIKGKILVILIYHKDFLLKPKFHGDILQYLLIFAA